MFSSLKHGLPPLYNLHATGSLFTLYAPKVAAVRGSHDIKKERNKKEEELTKV